MSHSTFNKSEYVNNRTVSLPATSSPVYPNSLMYTVDEIDNKFSPPLNDSIERPQSELPPSNLPSVHVKAQQQHRFISRKSVHRKFRNSQSLPDMKEGSSPDLIEVPFEDLVKGGNFDCKFSQNQQEKNVMTTIDESAINESNKMVPAVNGSDIDCAVDCLKDQEESYVTVDPVTSERRDSESFNRQLSDALIIPDPFEREQDETTNATENSMSSLLV